MTGPRRAKILTWAAQRAPGCDSVLVHDDDLDIIAESVIGM